MVNKSNMGNTCTKKGSRKAVVCSTIIFVAYLIAIMFLCLAKFSNSGIELDLSGYFLGIRLDRIIHFTMFLPFPFICWLFLKYHVWINQNKTLRYTAIILLGILFAAIAECSQGLFTTYRDSDPFDFCANITGIFTGSIIMFFTESLVSRLFDKVFKI